MSGIPRIRHWLSAVVGWPGAAGSSRRPAHPITRRGPHEHERVPGGGMAVVPADRGHPVRRLQGRAGKRAAQRARRRTAPRQSLLRGPTEGEHHLGTRRIQVRLAYEPLRPSVLIRLDIDHWSATSTALELIPCERVRPTATYSRAGHRLLDSLTRTPPAHVPAQQRLGCGAASQLAPRDALHGRDRFPPRHAVQPRPSLYATITVAQTTLGAAASRSRRRQLR